MPLDYYLALQQGIENPVEFLKEPEQSSYFHSGYKQSQIFD